MADTIMKANEKFGKLADEERLEKTASALEKNGFRVIIAGSGAEAKEKVLELIPEGAEVMAMTSTTADSISLSKEIDESGKFVSSRKKLYSMDRNTQKAEMRKLGSAPEWVVGSVHAVTEDGQALVASASGSQLPAYSYGAGKVIWVVGSQKIVKDVDEGLKRLYEYSLPYENERAKKVYGMGSAVNKILIVSREFEPERITLILVKEKLGF